MNTTQPSASFTLHHNGFYHYTTGKATTFINPAHVMHLEYDAGDRFLTIVFTDGTTRAYRLDGQTPEQAIIALLG